MRSRSLTVLEFSLARSAQLSGLKVTNDGIDALWTPTSLGLHIMVQIFAFRHQPIKALYLTYQLLSTIFVRLPYWTIIYVPKRWRPRPSWSLKRSVMVNLLKHLFYVDSRSGDFLQHANHLAISGGPGVKAVWVEAAPHLITGDVALWASIANVEPIRIPGYWIDKPGSDIPTGQKPLPGEKVLYSFHGGSYTQMSAHPNDVVAVIVRNIIQHCQPVQRAFALEYRLSSTDPLPNANPFPAALIDAVAGYDYLINIVGFNPSDVIIEGDSAGGNLALALTRYLVERHYRTDIPAPPGGLILVSPWADLSSSHDGPTSSLATFDADYAEDPKIMHGLWSRQAFVGPHGLGAAGVNRYISPASLSITASFTGFPRTFIIAGGAERLYDSILTLKNRMVADMGEGGGDGQVTYYEGPDAVHDYIAFAWFDPESTYTLQAIAEWL